MFEVKTGGSCEWKERVYLGSCLDTEVDIKCRYHQADTALHTIRTVVFRCSQVPAGLELKLFITLVISVLLYNRELWKTGQTLLDRLDNYKWHRKRLRQLPTIYYSKTISNEDLYARTAKTNEMVESLH